MGFLITTNGLVLSLFSNGLVLYFVQSRYDLGENMKQVNFDMFLKFQARTNRKTCVNTLPLNMRIGCVWGGKAKF